MSKKIISKTNSFKVDWETTDNLTFQMIDRHLDVYSPAQQQYVSMFLKLDTK